MDYMVLFSLLIMNLLIYDNSTNGQNHEIRIHKRNLNILYNPLCNFGENDFNFAKNNENFTWSCSFTFKEIYDNLEKEENKDYIKFIRKRKQEIENQIEAQAIMIKYMEKRNKCIIL